MVRQCTSNDHYYFYLLLIIMVEDFVLISLVSLILTQQTNCRLQLPSVLILITGPVFA